MFSLEGQKSKELIEKIQSLESPPLVIKEAFSEKKLQEILAIKEICYGNENLCQEKLLREGEESLGKMAHPDSACKDSLEKIFRPRLDPFFEKDYEMDFSFHRNYFPYGIHTDSGYFSEEIIYKQGILPLEVDPVGKDVFTVIFNQKSYHSAGYPRFMGEEMAKFRDSAKEHIVDFSEDKDISLEDLSRLWSGERDQDWLKGFSIALAFKWKRNSMAIWDRSHFHCSSDFSPHGINGKLGLMWITRLK